MSQGVESHTLRQCNHYASHDLPHYATTQVQCDMITWTHQYGHEIHSFINNMVYVYLNFILYLLDKHLQSILLTLLCLRGSVGYLIPYLVVTAYLSIATSHHLKGLKLNYGLR
jgi:hypothetical protein